MWPPLSSSPALLRWTYIKPFFFCYSPIFCECFFWLCSFFCILSIPDMFVEDVLWILMPFASFSSDISLTCHNLILCLFYLSLCSSYFLNFDTTLISISTPPYFCTTPYLAIYFLFFLQPLTGKGFISFNCGHWKL